MKQLCFFCLLFCDLLSYSQQTEFVDFKKANANVVFGDLKEKEVEGTITYEFEILKDIDSVLIDAKDFQSIKYVLDDQFSDSLYDGKQLIVKHPFKARTKHKLNVVWKTSPKKALYFIGWEYGAAKKQIWTQGQGKYTSNWLPSFDDMNEKVEFDLSISFNGDYDVIANGKLIGKDKEGNNFVWHYDMKKPMSSYLIALVIGKYNKKIKISKKGIPLYMYFYPEDSLKVEPTYRYTKQIFDYLEEEIGVPFPWQNYKQVPVKNFLYAGMENTGTTVFSDSFVIDSISFIDKNYVNVNAHELAHQWFGDLVTETSGTHHWLQEGFATYYALLAERNIFGDNYYYWRLYEYAQELLIQDQENRGTALLDSKASSSTFYKRGDWVLHVLREQIGDDAFKKVVINYLQGHKFKNVVTSDFILEVEKITGKSFHNFVATWLESKTFPFDEALKSLKRSTFIQEYLMADCEIKTSRCANYLSSGISDEAKIKIIGQIRGAITSKAFINNIKVRQSIAKSISKVPLNLKKEYESLLDDKSYLTIEMALFNLWNSFPEDRKSYLLKTKGIQGLNDKNVRMLWLALSLNTLGFENENKQKYFEELRDYTNPIYSFEIRQNAFQYLNVMRACDSVCQENLEQAAKSPIWQFSKFAKNMLANIKNEKQ